jgi:hypothetical protein
VKRTSLIRRTSQVVEMMLPKEVQKFQHLARGGKPYKLLSDLVDLVGIEPTTSSMPWNSSNRK